jgi:hypothetical protein
MTEYPPIYRGERAHDVHRNSKLRALGFDIVVPRAVFIGMGVIDLAEGGCRHKLGPRRFCAAEVPDGRVTMVCDHHARTGQWLPANDTEVMP